MVLYESELASAVQELLPGATSIGTSTWTVGLQNGCRHLTRISLADEILTLVTGPLLLDYLPGELLAINPHLPSGSRIVCSLDEVFLLTELPQGDLAAGTLDLAVRRFQRGLDILSGTAEGIRSDTGAHELVPVEAAEPSLNWKAVAGPDGTKVIALHDKQRTLHAVLGAADTTVQVLEPGTYPEETRNAVGEFLLRATAQVRFVKGCAGTDSGDQWSAWLQTSSTVCVDEALTALAVICRDCGAEAAALSEVRLAKIYSNHSSAWPTIKAAYSNERR